MAEQIPDPMDPNPLNAGSNASGIDFNSLANNPMLTTFLSMIGSNQNPAAAFSGGLQNALQARQANNQNQMQQLQLAQLKARQNFNPMQYLLSQQAAQQPQQAAGPATQAALAGQQGASNAQQIAGNTTTPYQAPPGAIGNVDMAGLLSGAAKAGMSPEEAQQMAGVIDPMTAIRMKLMSQPAVSVAPGASLVSPGLAQIQAMQNPQGGGAGGAQPAAGNAGAGQPSVLGAPGAQPGALFTNTNLPPDSQAAQVMNLTRARDMYAPNGPTPDPAKFASLDAALTKATGAQEQSLAQQKQNIENVKTYGDPALYEPYAQAVAKGQMPPPSNRTQTPATQAFQARVLQINPNYDAKDYEAKQQAVNSFASGPHGDILRSQAVAINHLGQLNTLVDALGNGNMPIVNQVANEWAKQNGGTAPTNFDAAKPIVTDEVMKAVLGAGGALGDRDTAQKALDSALTTPQLKGVLNQYTGLLYGQRQGLAQQYQTATGRTDFESRFPIIGSSSQAQTPSAANPASNFSQADRLAEARRRGLIK